MAKYERSLETKTQLPWIHGSDPSDSDEDKVSGDANQPASVVQRVDNLKDGRLKMCLALKSEIFIVNNIDI